MFGHGFKKQSGDLAVFHAWQTEQRFASIRLGPLVVALSSGQRTSACAKFSESWGRRCALGPETADGLAHGNPLKIRKIYFVLAIFHKRGSGHFGGQRCE